MNRKSIYADLESLWDRAQGISDVAEPIIDEIERMRAELETCRADAKSVTLDMAHVLKAQGAELAALKQQQPAQVSDGWADAYAAFAGAFDTPQMRRLINDDYSNDARKRLREFNEAMLAAAPQPIGKGE